MSDDRRRGERLEELLDALEAVEPARRERELDRLCSDPELKRRARAILAAQESVPGYLDQVAKRLGRSQRQETPRDLSGRRVGAWRLLKPLGRGGMGVVYEAERADGAFEQRVALKLLTTALTGSEAHQRFIAERQILAGLKHPAIAHVVDGGVTEDGTPWFAMEQVDGTRIDAYCDHHRLDIDRRMSLFLQVCDAVEHAHRRLVVHRDLKPANVLVTEERKVKLLDFGIASLLERDDGDSESAQPRTVLNMMTPEYASPEQVRGEPAAIGSDVYQLGLLLYELLSGQQPYVLRRHSPSEIERVICDQPPTRLSTVLQRPGTREGTTIETICQARHSAPARLRRRLRGDIETIVSKALSKEPERRYGSVDRMAQDLRRHIAGLPVEAQPDTWLYRYGKFFKRHAVGAVSTLVVIVLITGMTTFYTLRIQSERDRAQAEAEKARQVSEFLAGLFRSADPRQARGVDVEARRKLLDQGLARVDHELADQPQTRGDMLHVLGRTYLELGDYQKANTLLTRALDLRRKLAGTENAEIASTVGDIGRLEMLRGNYEVARSRLAEAQRIFETLPARHAAELADVLNDLGQVHRARGAYEEGRIVLERALSEQRMASGGPSSTAASIMRNIGTVLFEMDEYERAEQYYEEALAIYESQVGDDHPLVGHLLQDLARVRLELGKLSDLEAVYRRSLAITRQAYGSAHINVGVTQTNFGHFLTQTGRDSEAVDVLEGAVDTFRAALEPDHPNIAYPLMELGDAHLAGGRLKQAREHYRASLNHGTRSIAAQPPEFDPVRAYGLARLARVERELGKPNAADALLHRAVVTWNQAPGAIGAQLAPAFVDLVSGLRQAKRCGDAAPLIRRSLSTAEHRDAFSTPQIETLEAQLAACDMDTRHEPE